MIEYEAELVGNMPSEEDVAIKCDDSSWNRRKLADRHRAIVRVRRDLGAVGKIPGGLTNRGKSSRNQVRRNREPSIKSRVHECFDIEIESQRIVIDDPHMKNQVWKVRTCSGWGHRILPRATSPTLKM